MYAPTRTSTPIRLLPVLLGGLVVACGDVMLALSLWFPWTAAGVERLFQTIAVGVLGKASLDGGLMSALLGAALHIAMTTTFVVIYTLAARRFPALLQHPVRNGALYGLLLYVGMNFVVMPLSRVGRSPSFDHPDWIGISVLGHLVFGVVCVLAAQRALGSSDVASGSHFAGLRRG
jgi:hypothetical protein